MLTDAEKAYLGGIFDGEGWISIVKGSHLTKSGPKIYHQLLIGVGMANPIAINILFDSFGGTYGMYPSKVENRHDVYRWQISGKGCTDFLDEIGPYLKLKQPLVSLAKDYISTISGARITPEVDMTRERLTKAITEINGSD